jgi:hypothetical protein
VQTYTIHLIKEEGKYEQASIHTHITCLIEKEKKVKHADILSPHMNKQANMNTLSGNAYTWNLSLIPKIHKYMEII